MPEESLLVRVLRPKNRRFLVFNRTDVPEVRESEDIFSINRVMGRNEIRKITRSEFPNALKNVKEAQFIAIDNGSHGFDMVFTSILADNCNFKWDLSIQCKYSVADAYKFIEGFAIEKMSDYDGISHQIMESWIMSMVIQQAKQGIAENASALIKDKDSLPVVWWNRQLQGWLDECRIGIASEVTKYSWNSADALKMEIEKKKMADLEKIKIDEERERVNRLEEMKKQSAYEEEKRKIEFNRTLSDKEQEKQLEVLEAKHRKELLELEAGAEFIRHSKERAIAEHEAYLANLRNDQVAIEQVKKRESEISEREHQIQEAYLKAGSLLDQLMKLSEPLLKRLADADKSLQYQTTERLVSPEFGIPIQQLRALGFNVGIQTMIETIKKKEIKSSRDIRLTKHNFVTRDVGASKVSGLPIGESLEFELKSDRAGFVTVLNLGTSGNAFVHVPSALLRGREATIENNRTYKIPGQELLPWEWFYREEGPTGWEYMVAIVSDHLLIDEGILNRSTEDNPIVKLTDEELENLFFELSNLEEGSWSVGVLKFLVCH